MLLILVILVGATNVNRLDNNDHLNVLTRHKRTSGDFFGKIKSVSFIILFLLDTSMANSTNFIASLVSFNICSLGTIQIDFKAYVRVPRSYQANN